ncbi:MAG: HAMP domain-containing histidine kinase, partial [Deinococcus sp.]|nr:HAMP domain-containing histidine kinase [Deinococcus sp.]
SRRGAYWALVFAVTPLLALVVAMVFRHVVYGFLAATAWLQAAIVWELAAPRRTPLDRAELFELTPDAMVVAAPSGTVLDANPAAARLLGQPVRALRRKRLEELLPQLTASSRPQVTHLSRSDGSTAALLVGQSQLKSHHAVLYTMRDVTAEAKAEEDVLKKSAEVKALVHYVVHDMKNPIGVLQGSLRTVIDDPNLGELTVGQRKFLENAYESCDKALGMIHSLLDVNKLEAGEFKLNLEPCRFDEIVKQVLVQQEDLCRRKGQRLEALLPEHFPLVYADPEILRRMVQNLIANARKHTPRGSQIKVALYKGGDHDRWAVLAVADNGPGIPPEDREKIFERFVTLSNGKIKTGLGLHFCRLAALAHQGKLGVDSELGKGTTFHLAIPFQAEAPSR